MKNLHSSTSRLLITAAAFSLVTASANAVVLFSDSFNTNTLSTYNVEGGPNLTWNATAGVGGGGGLVPSGADGFVSIIPGNPNTAYLFGAGAANAVTISMMAKLGSAAGVSKAFLGLTNETAYGWNDTLASGNSMVGSVLQGTYQLGSRRSDGLPVGNITPAGQPTVGLTAGNWYLYSVTLTKPASGTVWKLDSSLQDFGTSGTTPGSVITSYAGFDVNVNGSANLNLTSTNTYIQFGIRGVNFAAVDSFSVTAIPEPSSYAALAGLFGLGLVLTRRRRA
jgi:hypothetical protein